MSRHDKAPLGGAKRAVRILSGRTARRMTVGVVLITGLDQLVSAAYIMEAIANRYRVPTIFKVMHNSALCPRWTSAELEFWTHAMLEIVLLGLGIGLAVAPWLSRKLQRLLGVSGQA